MYPKRHQDEYNRNRNKTRRTCDREFRDEDRTGKQCDEYPFASTWEGSATNGSDNFSVRMISERIERCCRDMARVPGTPMIGFWMGILSMCRSKPLRK
ncbi:NucA/NucB deoxyribonuclease domain-containing protein [Priestia megaterium]